MMLRLLFSYLFMDFRQNRFLVVENSNMTPIFGWEEKALLYVNNYNHKYFCITVLPDV